MNDPITQNAAVAVQQLQGRVPGAWDYSAASLEVVDTLLASFSRHVATLMPKLVENLIQMVSCYVLEVGKREHGGQYAWYREGGHTVLVVGEPRFSVAFSPYGVVRERLFGSPVHSTASLYRTFSESVRSAAPGTRAAWGIAPPS